MYGKPGEIDRIAGANNDEIGQHHETDNAQGIADVLEKRHNELGLRRQVSTEGNHIGGANTDQRLVEKLGSCRQAFRIAIDDLAIVIDPADSTETQGYRQHHPDKTIFKIGPQQRGNPDRHQNKRAAHGRRTGLREVRLRTIAAHRLTDLV